MRDEARGRSIKMRLTFCTGILNEVVHYGFISVQRSQAAGKREEMSILATCDVGDGLVTHTLASFLVIAVYLGPRSVWCKLKRDWKGKWVSYRGCERKEPRRLAHLLEKRVDGK